MKKWKSNGLLVLAAVCAGIAFGGLYRLSIVYIIAVVLIILLFLPIWKKNHDRAVRENLRLQEAQIYMEQLLYSFGRQEKLLTSLQELQSMFPAGNMSEVLRRAVHELQYNFEEEDSLKSGLEIIEESYQNERLHAIHRFLYQVERIGGEHDGIIRLLQKDLGSWHTRMDAYQKECRKYRHNVGIAIGISLLICMMTSYLLPAKVNIDKNPVRMVSTILFLVILLLSYTKMDRILSVNWLQHGARIKDGNYDKKYDEYQQYNKKQAQKASVKISLLPFLCGGLAFIFSHPVIGGICIILTILMLNQHTIGHRLSKKVLTREIEKAFPQWLMELSLLLQTNNVQVAIASTMETAPLVLQPALRQFQQQILEQPEAVEPYLLFLQEFSLPQIQSAMKMLYAVSAGNGGSEEAQLEELVLRNQQLMQKSEELYNEDSLGGMYLLFLFPAGAGGMKLICDMTIFLLTFFSSMQGGSL